MIDASNGRPSGLKLRKTSAPKVPRGAQAFRIQSTVFVRSRCCWWCMGAVGRANMFLYALFAVA